MDMNDALWYGAVTPGEVLEKQDEKQKSLARLMERNRAELAALYAMGASVPLTLEDFRSFVAERIVNAQEAAELLGCSRQYINELVKSGKLRPIKSSEKSTLFWKSDLLKRLWQE